MFSKPLIILLDVKLVLYLVELYEDLVTVHYLLRQIAQLEHLGADEGQTRRVELAQIRQTAKKTCVTYEYVSKVMYSDKNLRKE